MQILKNILSLCMVGLLTSHARAEVHEISFSADVWGTSNESDYNYPFELNGITVNRGDKLIAHISFDTDKLVRYTPPVPYQLWEGMPINYAAAYYQYQGLILSLFTADGKILDTYSTSAEVAVGDGHSSIFAGAGASSVSFRGASKASTILMYTMPMWISFGKDATALDFLNYKNIGGDISVWQGTADSLQSHWLNATWSSMPEVPEPSMYALLLGGLGALVCATRKHKAA